MSEVEAGLAKENQIVTEGQALKEGMSLVDLWLKKIDAAKGEEEGWRKSAARALAIYEARKSGTNAFNIFHSNVNVMVPALYNSAPVPDVRRRWEPKEIDPDDIVQAIPQQQAADPQQMQAMVQQLVAQAKQKAAREAKINKTAADVIERSLISVVDQHPFSDVMRSAVKQYKTIGRGVVRLRYTPTVDDDDVVSDDLDIENVPWDRFIRGPGRYWKDVPWIAFELDLDRDEIIRLKGSKATPAYLDLIGFNDQGGDADGTDHGSEKDRKLKHHGIVKTIKVYEVFDKRKGVVLFISPNHRDEPIHATKPNFRTKGFFPVPKPLQFMAQDSLTPICPYDVYETLINELDEVTRRISKLIKAMKVRGLYDSKMCPDFEKLKDCEDNEYIAASASEAFEQGGGKSLDDGVMHWPIETIAKALQQLYEQRNLIKETIYEVTNVSDVLRGATQASETATAQQIKSNSASLRIQDEQASVAELARELFRMMAEVLCTQFDPQNLSQMTGIDITPEVAALLKDPHQAYKIDIETDSTIKADMSRRHDEITGFLEATAQFGQSIAQVVQIVPGIADELVTMFTSVGRQFRLGKSFEDAVERIAEKASKGLEVAQQNSGPSPQELQMQQQQQQHDQQIAQQDGEREDRKLQAELALKDKDMQLKDKQIELETIKIQGEQQRTQMEAQAKTDELHFKRQSQEIDIAGKQQTTALKVQGQQADMANKQHLAEMEHESAEREMEHGEHMRGLEVQAGHDKLTQSAAMFDQKLKQQKQQQSKPNGKK